MSTPKTKRKQKAPTWSVRKKPVTIGGETVSLGETRQINLPFSETYLGETVSIPVYVMRAKKNGPRVLLTATIHGDELNGLGVLRQLLYDQPPTLLNGTLIIIPVVNVYGMENHTRYLPDRRDLNRSFPGSANGSISGRLAHVIFSEVVSQADYGIDFHTGALRRTNFPNVRADLDLPGTRFLAEAFGSELTMHSKGAVGTFRREATRSGVPTIILEAGEVWKIEPGAVETGVRGTLNVLRALGMMVGEPKAPAFRVVARRSTWVRAEVGGILAFHATVGALVRKGDVLAVNSTVFGEGQRTLVAPCDGVIVGMSTMPAVKPGEPVYHIAKLTRHKLNEAKRSVRNISSKQIFARMQDDLSTNVMVQE